MAQDRFQFNSVTRLAAGAMGQPGQRTFFLLVGREDRLVRLWLEKDQLQQLGRAIEQLLLRLEREHGMKPSEPEDPSTLDEEPGNALLTELQVGWLALGYDEERRRLALMAHEREAQEQGPPTLGCWATLSQMQALTRRISEVCAAGRPLCRLCGGPIDPDGHICPKANGHRPEGL